MKQNNKSKPLVIIQCYEDRQQTLPLRKADHISPEFATKNQSQPNRSDGDKPPPPPPMPATNGHHNGNHKDKEEQNNTLKNSENDIVTNTVHRKNGTLFRTPTPDYNTIKASPPVPLKSTKDEKIEMDSLESYKLKNPSSVQPKPPANYFVKAQNGSTPTLKHVRPVSVTIGEYTSGGTTKREPSKLDFLNGDKVDGNGPGDLPITNRLQSELVMTLSRSNLRKKTEAMADTTR